MDDAKLDLDDIQGDVLVGLQKPRDASQRVVEGRRRDYKGPIFLRQEGLTMSASGLPRAECPEQVGLSSARLERAAQVIRQDVERRLIPGAVLLIARFGRIGYAEAFGFRDREAGAAMSLDAIFRVASMTKPLTSVAR